MRVGWFSLEANKAGWEDDVAEVRKGDKELDRTFKVQARKAKAGWKVNAKHWKPVEKIMSRTEIRLKL